MWNWPQQYAFSFPTVFAPFSHFFWVDSNMKCDLFLRFFPPKQNKIKLHERLHSRIMNFGRSPKGRSVAIPFHLLKARRPWNTYYTLLFCQVSRVEWTDLGHKSGFWSVSFPLNFRLGGQKRSSPKERNRERESKGCITLAFVGRVLRLRWNLKQFCRLPGIDLTLVISVAKS